ncbi:MAG: class I SAM-dependent methyltransferase [Candidatus Binatia bacterium]
MSNCTPSGNANLQPRVDASCTACGAADERVIASAHELEVQRRYLKRFHRRRLEVRGGDALEERAEFTQDYATNVVACRECGLLYRDPRPGDDAIAKAYACDTYGGDRLDALFDSQLELFRPKARELAQRLSGARPGVVEIGSFVGGFLAACAELGWDAVGIDPGHEVADFCKARGLTVHRASAADCPIPAGSVDCVAIWNTFDQLPDPHPTLRAVQGWLRPGGLLVLRVPDGRCFSACMGKLRRWPPPFRSVLLAAMAWNNLLSFPYLHGYSPGTLDRLLGLYGFTRVHTRGDVLTRLSDEQTRPWARREEQLLKAAWMVGVKMSRECAPVAPWFDAYYAAPRQGHETIEEDCA